MRFGDEVGFVVGESQEKDDTILKEGWKIKRYFRNMA